MRVIIDRIEGNIAVVELPNRQMIGVPIALLYGAEQGDIVDIMINKKATEEKRVDIQSRFDGLKK